MPPDRGGGGSVAVRVVVMAADPEAAAQRRRELSVIVGSDRAGAIEALLVRRARTWALIAARVRGQGASRGRVSEVSVSDPAQLDPALLAADGPLLLAWPELPAWSARIGAAAVEDLAAGCAVSIGPLFDGGLYLLALGRPVPELLADCERPWRWADAAARVFEVAERRGLEVGLLRGEGGLRTRDDVRALLADPLTDEELRGLLG